MTYRYHVSANSAKSNTSVDDVFENLKEAIEYFEELAAGRYIDITMTDMRTEGIIRHEANY